MSLAVGGSATRSNDGWHTRGAVDMTALRLATFGIQRGLDFREFRRDSHSVNGVCV